MTYSAGYKDGSRDGFKDGFRAGQERMRARAAEVASRLATLGEKDPVTEELGYAAGSSISAAVTQTTISNLPILPS